MGERSEGMMPMRKLQWIFFGLYLIAVVAGAATGVWYLFYSEPVPPARPDLVVLPEDAPPAPPGYPTLKALYLAYMLGRIPVIDAFGNIPVPEGVIEKTDIEYGRVGERALLLDLYYPDSLVEPAPGLVFIHGGGWQSGDKRDYKYYTTRYAQRGYVVATIGYRFKQEAPFPACVEDAKCAVRWMRANTEELSVDPDRIAVIGGSAGGYLSMMVGYSPDVPELEGNGGHAGVSSAVACVVNLYGPTDLTADMARAHGFVESFLDTTYEQDPDRFTLASPIHHLDATDPPTLIIQGTIDDIVPVAQADLLAERLRELGVHYWYDRLDGWMHTLDIVAPLNERVQWLMNAFFEEHLAKKEKAAGTAPRDR